VKRYYATFRTLASLAKFEPKPARQPVAPKTSDEAPPTEPTKADPAREEHETRRRPDFHYNIQIHLPVTTDISVYNAIFKSLKDHLSI
jgi:hypothetical protein